MQEAAVATEVIVPVWGDRHVGRFLDVVAPSWLAPGNLPALADAGPLRLRLVTRRRDFARIRRHAVFGQLCGVAEAAFTPMDHLCAPAAAAVTLTMAYNEGVTAAAEPGRQRPFVFLNADFVLADGSLRTLAQTLRDGARLVLAPSLRAVEETLLEELSERVDEEGVLAMAPRDLVRLAMNAPHPTAMASRVDQDVLVSRDPIQLSWRADAHTLITRAFCLFPLAAVGDGDISAPGSFCDYELGATLSGGADPVILSDSDAYFALELTPSEQDRDAVRLGTPSLETFAAPLGRWTTEFHRRQCLTTLYVRSGDAAPALAETEAAAEAFVSQLLAELPPALPVRHHPRWETDLEAWRRSKAEAGRSPRAGNGARRSGPRALVRTLLFGEAGRRRSWQPLARVDRAVARAVADAGGAVVADPIYLSPYAETHFRGVVEAGSGAEPALLLQAVDVRDLPGDREVSEQARAAAGTAARLLLIVFRSDGGVLSPSEAAEVTSAYDAEFRLSVVERFDLRLDRRVERLHGRLAEMEHVGVGAAAALVASLAAACRLAFSRVFASDGDRWSALLLSGERRLEASTRPPAGGKQPATQRPRRALTTSEGD